MQKTVLFFLIYVMFNPIAMAQNLDWVKTIGGPLDESSWSTVIDVAGNVYTTGYFKGTVDFDPNAGVFNLTSLFASDVFIQKLDASGNLIWAKNMGGVGSDALGGFVAVDDFGNSYIVGRFNGTANFDPNGGTANLTAVGSTDIFILKLDPIGNLLWAKRIGASSVFNNENARSIVLDKAGNILISGYFYGTVDFDPNIGVANLTSAGGADVYILKLDAGGNYLWAKNLGGPSTGWVNDLITDNLDHVLLTGAFTGTVDFDPDTTVYNLTAVGNSDIYILKLNASGNFIWAKTMGGPSYEMGQGIATDSSNNVYTVGTFNDTLDFNPNTGTTNLASSGGADIYVHKLDASGNFIWARNMGGIYPDIGHAIATDVSGSVYTTGYFGGTADFDPGVGVYNLTANNPLGYYDAFVHKLNTEGDFQWVKGIGGKRWDVGTSISIDDLGNVYTTGRFSDTTDFDPSIGVFNVASQGGRDVFIQKLKPCVPNTGTDVIVACDSIIWIDGNTYRAANNTATHTLRNSVCCDSVVTLDLTLMALVVDTLKNEGCFGLKGGFINTSVVGGNPPFSFVWNTAETTTAITALSAGLYRLTVTDATGCVIHWQDTLKAFFTPSVAPFVGQGPMTDTTINWNDVIWVDVGNNQTANGVLYTWTESSTLGDVNFNDATAPRTTINPQPASSGTYTLLLTATSVDGCIDTGSLRITVNIAESLGIPSAFTPNGDGANDFFRPVGLDDQFILEFKIYNRWGQLVFDDQNTSSNWDGTFRNVEQPFDVYLYILRYQIPSQKEKVLKGNFTLIR